MELADLDPDKVYSYADYYKWTFKDRVELIDGKIFRKEPQVPNTIHQLYCGHIFYLIAVYFGLKVHKVFSFIFDVRLPDVSIKDEDVFTVVQPDICVILDENKLDDKGGIGAPDIVIEIMSPGHNTVDLKDKFYAYQKAGVKEYWIIFPYEKAVLTYKNNGTEFTTSCAKTLGDHITTSLLPGFSLELAEVFQKSKFLEEREKAMY